MQTKSATEAASRGNINDFGCVTNGKSVFHPQCYRTIEVRKVELLEIRKKNCQSATQKKKRENTRPMNGNGEHFGREDENRSKFIGAAKVLCNVVTILTHIGL